MFSQQMWSKGSVRLNQRENEMKAFFDFFVHQSIRININSKTASKDELDLAKSSSGSRYMKTMTFCAGLEKGNGFVPLGPTTVIANK